MLDRFVCHLPYYRQAEICARQEVNFHRKTRCDWAALGADWLAIIYRALQREHWRSRYRQFDETPIDYLEPSSGKAQTGYLWTSNIPDSTVIYHWRSGRDAGGIVELFGEPGDDEPAPPVTIQSDGYSAYPAWARDKPHITLAGCHAHLRRKFYEAREQEPRLVAWILRQLGQLYRIEKQLREAKAGPALREAVRASQSRMIHRRLNKLIERLALRAILPKSKLGKAIHYTRKQWSRMEVYLSDGRIEIDTGCGRAPRGSRHPSDQARRELCEHADYAKVCCRVRFGGAQNSTRMNNSGPLDVGVLEVSNAHVCFSTGMQPSTNGGK